MQTKLLFFALSLSLMLTVGIVKVFSSDCIPDANGIVTCNDFNANATLNIDLRIATKHDPAVNKKTFGTMSYVLYQQRKFTRNVNCWAYDLDLTCASPFNSRGGNQRAGTLVTPRHIMLAEHFPYTVGDSVFFITKDNQTIRRKVIGESFNVSADIQLVTIDKDVPTTITPALFLPSDYGKYLANNGKGLPTLYFDQEENALVAEVGLINSSGWFYQQTPTNANRIALYEELILGDSGDPCFLVLSGKLILLNTITGGGPGSGPSLTYYANLPDGGSAPNISLNDLIKLSDAKGSVNTDYKVKYFDFTGTSAVDQTSKPKDLVISMPKSIRIVLAEFNTPTEMQIRDLSGRLIKQQTIVNHFEYNVLQEGVYFVTLKTLNIKKTFKVIVQ